MKKTSARISLAIVFTLQAAFLLAIFMEKVKLPIILALVAIIFLLMILAWRKIPHHSHDHLWEDVWLVGFVALGAVVTFWLTSHLGLSSVIAVGIIGVLASFIPSITPVNHLTKQIPAAAYCGAFVGMTSPKVAGDFDFILLASVAAGVLLILSKNVFHGYGGKLGTVAFGGVVLVVFLIETFVH